MFEIGGVFLEYLRKAWSHINEEFHTQSMAHIYLKEILKMEELLVWFNTVWGYSRYDQNKVENKWFTSVY